MVFSRAVPEPPFALQSDRVSKNCNLQPVILSEAKNLEISERVLS